MQNLASATELTVDDSCPPERPGLVWALAAVLVAAVAAVYADGLHGALVFDDGSIVLRNPTIRDLRRLGVVLTPPRDGTPVQGRPLFNLTLALNYAISGDQRVAGYHEVNVALHALSALTLFGLVRRTLRLPGAAPGLAPRAAAVAFAAALLWAVHPLASSAVDYVSQRSELLVSLFYLLTLYCVCMNIEHPAWYWLAVATGACLLGMASKEVMVTAPLVALLYDRTFAGDTWRQWWGRRRGIHLLLAATWGLLAALVFWSGSRNATAGVRGPGTVGQYVLTQCDALAIYLKLHLWPRPLVFDYGQFLLEDWRDAWPQALVVLLLLAVIAVTAWRRPKIGFLGLAWLMILAPTSSVVPVWSQTIGEHRAYLPLAAAVVAAVVGGANCAGWRVRAAQLRWPRVASLALFCGLVAAAGCLTARRNLDFRDALGLWEDVIRKRPQNARAWTNHGDIDYSAGRFERAIAYYDQAVRIMPGYAEALCNRGNAHLQLGHLDAALADYSRAIDLPSSNTAVYYRNRGAVYTRVGMHERALPDFNRAIELDPTNAEGYYNRGSAFRALHRLAEAEADLSHSLRLNPADGDAWNNLGLVHFDLGRLELSASDYTRSIELNPLWTTFYNRGNTWLAMKKYPEAVADYTRAAERSSGNSKPLVNRCVARALMNDFDGAWSDVRMLRQSGTQPTGELINWLTGITGRSQ